MSVPCRCPVSSALPCFCLNSSISPPLYKLSDYSPTPPALTLITPRPSLKSHIGMTFSTYFDPLQCTRACILKPYAGGVRRAKRAPRYLPSLSGLSKRFPKNYSDICMNRGSKAPRRKTHHQCQPASPPPSPRSFLCTVFINANCAPSSPHPLLFLHTPNLEPEGFGIWCEGVTWARQFCKASNFLIKNMIKHEHSLLFFVFPW